MNDREKQILAWTLGVFGWLFVLADSMAGIIPGLVFLVASAYLFASLIDLSEPRSRRNP